MGRDWPCGRIGYVARLWADADGAERNALLRLLAVRAEIEGGALKELVLSDDASPLIEAACQNGIGSGSDGLRSSTVDLTACPGLPSSLRQWRTARPAKPAA